ncbi:MAG TPA: C-terminal binding protein [Quisquiliibacterium sp.]|nr:C-terminal binding protein [Quisquiliibacterium sp.]
MRVLLTDYDMIDLSIEQAVFGEAGIELVAAQCRTPEDVIRGSEGCSALLFQYAPIGAEVFDARPAIGICSKIGAGYDTLDIDEATRRGVWVANSPDYGIGEVATHALAMLLDSMRCITRYDRDVHEGTWNYASVPPIRRATSLTVGILGLGRIGKRFAHLARNVFGRLVACDPYLIDGDFPPYVERVSLEELFRRSDAVAVHCLLSDETRGIVDGRLLRLMRPGGYLVNTARGAIVDIDALVEVLREDRLAGVGLDVLPEEPLPANHPLLADRRVLLSPHAAFYSDEADVELRRKAAMNIVTWMRTGRPDYPVNAGSRRYAA